MNKFLLILLILPSICLGFQQDFEVDPEARFGNLFGNFFHKFYVKPQETVPVKPKLCLKEMAVFVDGKCLLFQAGPATKAAAVLACTNIGGKLYEHNIQNPFLFEYLYKFYPGYFGAALESVWSVYTIKVVPPVMVGGTPTITIIDGNMMDVTNNPYFANLNLAGMQAPVDGQCIFFNHVTGNLVPTLSDATCANPISYVCEFPSNDKTFVQDLGM